MPKPIGMPEEPNWFEQVESALLGTRARVLTGSDGRWSPEPIDFACPAAAGTSARARSHRRWQMLDLPSRAIPRQRLIRLGRFEAEPEAIPATKYEARAVRGRC